MIFIAIGFAITFASRALTRLPFLIAASSLHKHSNISTPSLISTCFFTVGIQAHTLILLVTHVQCIGDYCGGRGL